ncbi:hypothetical protein [Streptomyces sp. SID3212]|uniref:hypothetical protein n=1 Tax=Streptomyces sp. SID3212 TaxID=2690259 RepID=UPI0031F6FD2F
MRSVERWRRAWREGGEAGVLSRGRREDLGSTKSSRRAGTGVGAWSAGSRLDGPAVDAGTDQDACRPAVPRLLHGRGHLAAAEAARLELAAAHSAGDRAR